MEHFTEKVSDMRPLALALIKLPEKARERIAYIVEGALLVQEATEPKEPEAKAG